MSVLFSSQANAGALIHNVEDKIKSVSTFMERFIFIRYHKILNDSCIAFTIL